jgi:hypothetical protein
VSEDLQKIKALIAITSAYYAQPIQNEVVQMYAEDLVDLGFERVKAALLELRRDPNITRFPLPAKIRAKLNPSVDDKQVALDLAKRITAAVVRHGYTWTWKGGFAPHETFEAAVKAELGELAWEMIRRRGGWQKFHDEFFESNEGIFTAQLRDHIEAVMRMAKAGELHALPSLPQQVGTATDTGPKQIGQVIHGITAHAKTLAKTSQE